MNRGHSKLIGLFWVMMAVLVGAAFVVGIPLLARSVPWSYEKKISDLFVGELTQFQVCESAPGKAAFKKIVNRIYPVMPGDREMPITVELIEGKEVNAFASLGGKIFVYDGLIQQAQSAEEVAGVLAHEIEHVKQRHVIQGVLIRVLTVESLRLAMGQMPSVDPQLVTMLFNMKFSREQEADADFAGLRRLQAAKVDVAGFRKFFEREDNQIAVPSLLSDHPSSENRAELTRQFEGGAIQPLLELHEWLLLKNLCSLQKHRK